jgi:hypothetical protein
MDRPALEILIAQPDHRLGLLRGQRQRPADHRAAGDRRQPGEHQYPATT